MVGKGLLAVDAALRPAHCPKILPVTSRKCFVMLSTAQNRCGVFAGIGTMLTGRHKTAIVLHPAGRGRYKTRFSGGAGARARVRVHARNTMDHLQNTLANP
jgi:hypothetical protein